MRELEGDDVEESVSLRVLVVPRPVLHGHLQPLLGVHVHHVQLSTAPYVRGVENVYQMGSFFAQNLLLILSNSHFFKYILLVYFPNNASITNVG